jgi:hypothetical protein
MNKKCPLKKEKGRIHEWIHRFQKNPSHQRPKGREYGRKQVAPEIKPRPIRNKWKHH